MSDTRKTLPKLIFLSRWLQAPLYLGLILVLAIYIYQFGKVLIHMIWDINISTETSIMLQALDLIDVVMIANLLIMVVIGGYQTFVSNLELQDHPDKPEWLLEMSSGTLKTKLALALVGISSIHLLRTFIDPVLKDNYAVMWQVVIHLTLVVSAIAIAFSNKLAGSKKRV